jgi:hypothetical protein
VERRTDSSLKYLKGRTALERQARSFFRPSSATTATRWAAWEASAGRNWIGRRQLTQDQLIRQVIQGGGNMPAYGKNLSPAETTALVAFLETLHPAGQAPARDASRVVGSPLAAMDHHLLTAHMAQHLLLMTVSAPLILLGAPVIVLLNGLPKPFGRSFQGRCCAARRCERLDAWSRTRCSAGSPARQP